METYSDLPSRTCLNVLNFDLATERPSYFTCIYKVYEPSTMWRNTLNLYTIFTCICRRVYLPMSAQYNLDEVAGSESEDQPIAINIHELVVLNHERTSSSKRCVCVCVCELLLCVWLLLLLLLLLILNHERKSSSNRWVAWSLTKSEQPLREGVGGLEDEDFVWRLHELNSHFLTIIITNCDNFKIM